MTPLIEIRDIVKTYNREEVATTALRGISLSIAAGEFVAIMGQSGSGKSTLLHILGLLDQPTSGQYIFNGHDTTTWNELQRSRFRNQAIGFIFQAFHLLPRTTVLDNVILPLAYSPVPAREHRAQALAALEKVNLTHRLRHYPSQLSGGEKQRVAIARALINRPQVIFADEPTGNLDSQTGRGVMETIDALHKSGHTIIVITHETPAANYAQRLIELRDGAVISDCVQTGRNLHYHK